MNRTTTSKLPGIGYVKWEDADNASSSPLVAVEKTEIATSTSIQTPKGLIQAQIVSQGLALEKGLGDRDSLPENEGMLFNFPYSEMYRFWMKDMRFSIDIVWMNDQKQVIWIQSHVSPDTYPQSFGPSVPSKYVLEINSGNANRMGIATGTQLIWK